MKISLKSTILIICFVIVGVIAYQFYWLNNLYHTSKEELDTNIVNSLKIADRGELQLRVKALEADSTRNGTIESAAGFQGEDMTVTKTETSVNMKDSLGQTESKYMSVNDTTNKKEEPSVKGSGEAPDISVFEVGKLEVMMLKGFHQALDMMLLPNVQNYDSLLTKELLSYDITKRHYVDWIDTKTDSILGTSCLDSTLINRSGMVIFDHVFGSNDQYLYRLYIENPNSEVIRQMVGILMASMIVLLLLAFLFYYLMHTIWRQKTLEEMKDDFINNMTHEFKTPLSVSYAAVDALLITEKGGDKEQRDKYLNIAKDQIDHLTGLVEQILAMSRESKQNVDMNPEKIELKYMVESIIRQQSLAAKKRIEFDVCITPDDLIVVFDRMHLANVLNNLIENSIKYSGDMVKIRVEAESTPGKEVKISVIDNGIGVDAEKQKNLFDKFYRVPTGDKHNVKGYGLGLFYVKETMERAGARVSVKSKPGEGAAFTIQIPQ